MSITDLTIVLLSLGSALYLLILGVILKRRSIREGIVSLLILYITAYFLWVLGQGLLRLELTASGIDELLPRLLLYGLLLLSLLFFQLNWSFLRWQGHLWAVWTGSVLWLAFVVTLNENWLGLPDPLWVGQGLTVHRAAASFSVAVIGWAGLMGMVTVQTIMSYYRTHEPLHRNRLTSWSIVLGLTTVGGALFLADYPILGDGFYLIGILIALYVVLVYRLPDVRQMARRSLSYVISTFLAVGIYTVGILLTQYAFQSVPGYSPYLAGATMALILVILFAPLQGVVQRFINRLISGASYDSSRTLREYSIGISNILDLDRLATIALGLISEALEIRRGTLFLVNYEEEEEDEGETIGYFYLRSLKGMGDQLPPGVLAADSPVAVYLAAENRPLTQYDIDLLPRFRDIFPEERTWLTSLRMAVYVPIYAHGEWIGLLALGSKLSGDRYFDNDLTLLSTLAGQTAVALENARLFNDLKIRNIEIEKLNQELTEVNQELARLDQAKSDFIGVASHELRTPLTHVRGYNDILRDMLEAGPLPPNNGLEMVNAVKKGVDRLERIVNTMLDVSQIDTKTLDLRASPTSLAPIISQIVEETYAEALIERNLTLTTEGLADLPAIVADDERLEQLFSHLIQNGIKYTPDGGQIQIAGYLREGGMLPPHPMVEIVIKDSGIGIAPDDLERIFEKFYRVGEAKLHSTGSTKFKGAGPGLGLTIARGIVEAHGGRIWAESPGYDEESCPGTTFHLLLPVQLSRLEVAGSDIFAAEPSLA